MRLADHASIPRQGELSIYKLLWTARPPVGGFQRQKARAAIILAALANVYDLEPIPK